jgi:hypothetical protein
MKKLILSENQAENLINQLLEEDSPKLTYKTKIIFYIEGSNLKHNGREIDDMTYDKVMTVSFQIDQDHRSWGISDISIYNIDGDKTLEIEVEIGGNSETIQLPINWENVEKEYVKGKGVISLDDSGTIELVNDENGQIKISKINVTVFGL